MYGEACLPFVFGICFVLVQNGHGLQCWKCSSHYDVNCRDYFNITKLELYKKYYDSTNYGNRQIRPMRSDPHVEVCDESHIYYYNYKNVCLKTVSKGAHGIPEVRRGCVLVQKTLKSGECPDELKDHGFDFCETCESDQCNAAGQTKTNTFLVAAITTLIALFLRI